MKKFTILCGPYGSGKTNLAVNMAINRHRKGGKTILCDLDIADPYFRTTDYGDFLEENDIKLVAPTFSGTTLDLPVLPPDLFSVFSQKERDVIVDVGGEESGARVLRRFNKEITSQGYNLFYVVNYYRYMQDITLFQIGGIHNMEDVSRLKINGIINNSHLKDETTAQDILDSVLQAKKLAKALNVSRIINTVPVSLLPELIGKVKNIIPIDTSVKAKAEF